MTLSLPEDLVREMRSHAEINWSEVARRSIRRELDRMHVLDKLLADSRLTEDDAVALGREIRKAAARRWGWSSTPPCWWRRSCATAGRGTS